MISTNDNNIDVLEEVLKCINEDWIFKGVNNDIKVPIELINEDELKLLHIVNDLYFVESINRLKEQLNILTDISEYHKLLVFLKYIYQVELKKFVNDMIENDGKKIQYDLVNPIFKNLSSIWEYLFLDFEVGFDPSKIVIIILFYDLFLGYLQNNETSYYSYKTFSKQIANDLNEAFRNHILNDNKDNFLQIINSLIFLIENTNNTFNNLINKCQHSLLFTFTITDYKEFSKGSFLKSTIKEFKKKLRNNEKLYEILETDVNCLATMSFNNKKYITINGLDAYEKSQKKYENRKKMISIITDIIENENIKYVEISDETRYYLKESDDKAISKVNNNFIDYRMYKAYINSNKVNKLNKLNRMFTCCERKLIAEALKENKNENRKKIISLITDIIENENIKYVETSDETRYYFEEADAKATLKENKNENRKKIISLITDKIENENIKYLETSDETRYYFEGPDAKATLKENKNENRNLIKLTIAMKPCELCRRAIKYTKIKENLHISINRQKKIFSLKENNLGEMDELAEEIFNSKRK